MMFKFGLIIGILIMCMVPTSIHNKIRSTAVSVAASVFQKLANVAVDEKKYEIVKVPINNK